MTTNTKLIFVFIFLLLIALVSTTYLTFQCKTSDKEAIKIAKAFFDNVTIKYTSEPLVAGKSISELAIFGSKSKVVVVGVNKYKIKMIINCNDGEIIHFSNDELMLLSRNKYTVTKNNKQTLSWPPFIPEDVAKNILLSVAGKMGLQHDIEFHEIKLDKSNGIWTAIWERKFNGIVYEGDYIAISIMAVDGQLQGFTKWFKGEPCSTEAKISRSEAIATAYNKFADYFSKDTWHKNKDKFEMKSAELKIISDNAIWKRILPLNNKSRLAWVVIYDIKNGMNTETIGILNKDESIIRIDAATKKIISSEINVVQ